MVAAVKDGSFRYCKRAFARLTLIALHSFVRILLACLQPRKTPGTASLLPDVARVYNSLMHNEMGRSSGEKEPLPWFITWIKDKLVSAGDVGCTTHFWYNCLVWPHLRMTDNAPAERTSSP